MEVVELSLDAVILSRRKLSRNLVFLTVVRADDTLSQVVVSRDALGARFDAHCERLRVGSCFSGTAHADVAPEGSLASPISSFVLTDCEILGEIPEKKAAIQPPRRRRPRPPRWTRDELSLLERAEAADLSIRNAVDVIVVEDTLDSTTSAATRAAAEGTAEKPCVRQNAFVHTRGEYASKKKDPQIRALLHLISAQQLVPDAGAFRILDLGGGRGDLGIALAGAYPRAHVTVVDKNAVAVAAGEARAGALALTNVSFAVGDGAQAAVNDAGIGPLLIVGLHACGVLTDILLHAAVASRSSFACVPCCFSALCRDIATSNTSREMFDNSDEVRLLSRMADSPEREISCRAMRVIASRRVAYVRSKGCNANLMQMDESATLRNICIFGQGSRA